jgi:hypothetical protein
VATTGELSGAFAAGGKGEAPAGEAFAAGCGASDTKRSRNFVFPAPIMSPLRRIASVTGLPLRVRPFVLW